MLSLKAAADVARQQQATLLELRATVSGARAALAGGQPAEALGTLQALVHSLPVEFDPENLAEARELLATERCIR